MSFRTFSVRSKAFNSPSPWINDKRNGGEIEEERHRKDAYFKDTVRARSFGHAITYPWETPASFHKVSRKSKLGPRKKGGLERETIQGVCRLGDTGAPRVVKPLEIHPRESNPCSLHRPLSSMFLDPCKETSIRIGSNGPNAFLYRVTLTEFHEDGNADPRFLCKKKERTISFLDMFVSHDRSNLTVFEGLIRTCY